MYPADIAMFGQKAIVARARAAIASRLTATAAHLTTSKESQAIEDRIEQVAQTRPDPDAPSTGLPPGVADSLASIDETLAHADLDSAEWELLYRMRLQVERDLLIGADVGETFAGDMRVATTPAPSRPGLTEWAVAAAIAVAITADLGLAVWDRVGRRDP